MGLFLSPVTVRLCSQLFQQCPGVLQVGGVKAFGEPAVDRRQQRRRLRYACPAAATVGQAHGGAQLPGLGLLTAGNGQGLLEAGFRLGRIRDGLAQQQGALEAIGLRLAGLPARWPPAPSEPRPAGVARPRPGRHALRPPRAGADRAAAQLLPRGHDGRHALAELRQARLALPCMASAQPRQQVPIPHIERKFLCRREGQKSVGVLLDRRHLTATVMQPGHPAAGPSPDYRDGPAPAPGPAPPDSAARPAPDSPGTTVHWPHGQAPHPRRHAMAEAWARCVVGSTRVIPCSRCVRAAA